MTQEEKHLLLIDLCARLPYGVQCEIGGLQHGPYTFTGDDIEDLIAGRTFKPYLRPMSSMTEEEKKEFLKLADGDDDDFEDIVNYPNVFGLTVSIETFDWLNEHHFDYRGLIRMGLALEAPEGMYND